MTIGAMRNWTLVAVVAALGLGGAFGWVLHGGPKEVVKIVERPVRVATMPRARPQRFPDYPKPAFELPPPESSDGAGGTGAIGTPMPSVIVGDLPNLPTTSAGDPGIALTPDVPVSPVADLNADEALTRRIVLQGGGEIVSSADAKDATGKIGRTLVAETLPAARDAIRAALRKALGDRAILSDGGSVDATGPELQKAEADLAAARKQRDKARLDFLPEAPALKGIEEEYARLEKVASDLRKASTRLRLNILLRPVLSS